MVIKGHLTAFRPIASQSAGCARCAGREEGAAGQSLYLRSSKTLEIWDGLLLHLHNSWAAWRTQLKGQVLHLSASTGLRAFTSMHSPHLQCSEAEEITGQKMLTLQQGQLGIMGAAGHLMVWA